MTVHVRSRRSIDNDTIEVALKVFAIVVIIALAIAGGIISGKQFQRQQEWLRACAFVTHGSVEREPDGETIHTDGDGRPYRSSVNWHYFVRTGSGKRIEYNQPYE